jgi:2-polyprenyl-6-methoxyphenol hydroxylase-like FAD-dependent oxidoreductase
VLSEADRVIIIGAGPAGKTAAVALNRVGIRSELYERVREFHLLGVAFGVQTSAMRGLLKLGIGSRLAERALIADFHDMYSMDDKELGRLPVGELGRETGMPAMAVLRRDYEEVLLGMIDPDTLHLDHECVSIEQDPDGVTAHFANGTSARGTMLIGADGLHSAVRRHLVGETELRYSGYAAWRGCIDVEQHPIPNNVIRWWSGAGGQAGLFPLPGKLAWGAVAASPQGASDPPGGHVAAVLAALPNLPQVVVDAVRATDESLIVRGDLCDREPITKWTTGRVVLMGDAAHPTTPFLGQGLGLCIEDAVVLAKELALTDGLADRNVITLALKSYERYRIDRAAQIVLGSRKFAQNALEGNTAKRAISQRAMRMMPASKWRKIVDDLSGYEV